MDLPTTPTPDGTPKNEAVEGVVPAPAEATPGVPEGAHFTEVPAEAQLSEHASQPGKVIGKPAVPIDKVTPKQAIPPKPKEAGTKQPVLALSLAVIIFVALAAGAYYAYTKTK